MPAVEAAAPNSAPSIAGDEVCIGPAGREHVFPLEFTDPDGDAIQWRAETVEPRGSLHPLSGGVPSGSLVHLVYRPPAGRDSNAILVTAEDGRGGTTTKRLLARSG